MKNLQSGNILNILLLCGGFRVDYRMINLNSKIKRVVLWISDKSVLSN